MKMKIESEIQKGLSITTWEKTCWDFPLGNGNRPKIELGLTEQG